MRLPLLSTRIPQNIERGQGLGNRNAAIDGKEYEAIERHGVCERCSGRAASIEYMKHCQLLLIGTLLPLPAMGAHPLITEDTSTEGRGRYQFELTRDAETDVAADFREESVVTQLVFTYGLRDDLDLIGTLPHQRRRTESMGAATTDHGLSDVSFESKWRFFERGALSFAVKPGVTFATGEAESGLGQGKTGYSVFGVATYASAPWAFHLHLGYTRNRNTLGERDDIHHASIAVTRFLNHKLQFVGDISTNTNADPNADGDSETLVLGAIYSIYPDLDVDLGYRKGLSNPAADRAVLLGMAWRF